MTTPLERLSRLVPPPEAAGQRDWTAAEVRLGRPLPQDYKSLVGMYGGGSFDDYIGLLVPPPTRTSSEIVHFNDGHMDDLTDMWDPDSRPASLTRDDLLLVAWADTIDADTLYWLVEPDRSPQTWSVVVLHADIGECELYPMTCTEFLAGLFSGKIISEILSHHLRPNSHTFRPIPHTGDC